MRIAFLALGVVFVFAACGSSETLITAETVFKNGRVWIGPGDTDFRDALAVEGGRIAAVGSDRDLGALIGPRTDIVDLNGGFMMPGFIDSHTHFVDGGFQLLGLDLRPASDEADFARRIGEWARQIPEGSWITGGDWDHESWPSRDLPTRDLIDSNTAGRYVFVNRLDGHMALANSKVLQSAGITRATPDPPGGKIVRDKAGEPTGVLKDAAMELVHRIMPERSDKEIRSALEAAFQHAARLGVTTVNAILSLRDFRVIQELAASGVPTARIYAIVPVAETEKLRAVGIRAGFGTDYLKLGAVKAFMDGSLGSSTAWFYEPYLDQPETCGLPSDLWFPPGNMERVLHDADASGLQLVIHAIGDRANDELLNIFEGIAAKDPRRDRRFRIEHAQHLSGSAIARFKELGVIPSMQPYHAIDDGRWAERRLGRERLRTTYAFRSLIDGGAQPAFGSDWPVAPLDPLSGIDAAVNRRTLDGENPGGWVPEERISVREALLCYTRNAAYAIFEEHRLGALETGMWADLVVLSANPFELPPDRLTGLRVIRTVVEGRTVFEDTGS